MIDETTGNSWESPNTAAAEPQPTAFCQDCGRPLTPDTVRTVGNAVFCEPCLHTRLNPGAVPPPPPPPPGAPYGTPVPPAAVSSVPSPALAFWIGLLPGAGAMYNGQYAKGFAHLIIFAVLANLGDHASSFGVLCFGWIIYMVFDAVATARARRDGLPLPNPLHLNDIGDRIAQNWQQSQQQAAARAAQPPTNPAASQWQPVPPPPAPAQANWAGYVPPTAFGAPAAAPFQPAQPGSYPQTGYVPPATSQPGVDPSAAWTAHGPATVPPVPYTPARRFPVAAIVLIALGILFLIGNVFPDIHISGDTTTAIVLGAVAAWSFYRRFTLAESIRQATGVDGSIFMIHMLRFPIIVATVAVMFALHALGLLTPGQSFPLLLIVGGLLILVERVGLPNGVSSAPISPSWNPTPSPVVPETSPAAAAEQAAQPAQDSEVSR